MTTARKIANARLNVPHDDGHAPRQCNLPECPEECAICGAPRYHHWDGIGPRPNIRPVRLHEFERSQDDDKTPPVATDDLWSMSLDRMRLRTQLDAVCEAIETAKTHMRYGFELDPISEAGARDMHFAKAWAAIAHLGRA